MTSPEFVVFVDFENVPEIDLGLVEGQAARVTLLLGRHQKKLELGMVRAIHRLGAQVELVEVGATGHNALDIILACHLGRAIERNPRAEFFIVSNDKDFEPLIAHLRTNDVKVSRVGDFSQLPFVTKPAQAPVPAKPARPAKTPKPAVATKPVAQPAAAASTAPDRSAAVITRLQDPKSRNRPARRKALEAWIRSHLGTQATDAAVEGVIRKLQDAGVRIDPKGRVTY